MLFSLISKILLLLCLNCLVHCNDDFCFINDPYRGDCCYVHEDEKDRVHNITSWFIAKNEWIDCIYVHVVERWWYDITKNWTSAERRQTFKEKANRFRWALPTKNEKGNVPISITFLRLRDLSIDEKSQTLTFHGNIGFKWKDDRFTWVRFFSKRPEIHLWIPKHSSSYNIWRPDLYYEDNTWFDEHLDIKNDGQMSYDFDFDVHEICPFDYSFYPFDEHECCLDFHGNGNNDNNTEYSFAIDKPTVVGSTVSKLWTDVETYIRTDTGAVSSYGHKSKFAVCVSFTRASASAVTEILLPLAVTVMLSILLPIFCSWKYQALSKCFCLVLQFACSFVLTLDTQILQFGSTTPRLLKLHQFVIWTTMLSLVSTFVIWKLSKRPFNQLPPESVIRVAGIVNALLWWSSPDDKNNDEDVAEIKERIDRSTSVANGEFDRAGSIDVVAESLHRENSMKQRENNWRSVWLALNRVMQMIFAFVYIIGTLSLALN